jgi:hypothetical protein
VTTEPTALAQGQIAKLLFDLNLMLSCLRIYRNQGDEPCLKKALEMGADVERQLEPLRPLFSEMPHAVPPNYWPDKDELDALDQPPPPAPPEPRNPKVFPALAVERAAAIEMGGGLSLRDLVAAQALQGLLTTATPVVCEADGFSTVNLGVCDGLSVAAYALADAMLMARRRGGS